jgi:predicted GIY-YIG superfamily endonuclease
MSDVPTINWTGKSGQQYLYHIYPINSSFKEEGGNYIFAKETTPNHWSPVYIGQTKNLNQRLENHEKEKCATRNGATHIHAHLNNTENSRLSEEKDLILKWQPTCNEQLVR